MSNHLISMGGPPITIMGTFFSMDVDFNYWKYLFTQPPLPMFVQCLHPKKKKKSIKRVYTITKCYVRHPLITNNNQHVGCWWEGGIVNLVGVKGGETLIFNFNFFYFDTK